MSQSFTVRLAKITGTPSSGYWSQTHTFFPEDEEKKKKRGILLACFAFWGKGEEVEALTTGREILSRLHEEFYGQLEGTAFDCLSQAVTKVYQEFSDWGESLEIVAASVIDNVLCLASQGGGQAWACRKEAFQKVLSGGSQLEKASGFLQADDFLVLATTSFFEIVPWGTLKAALLGFDPQEAVDALAPLVTSSQSPKVAAIFGKVEKEVDEELVFQKPLLQEEKPILPSESKQEIKKRNFSRLLTKFKLPWPGKIRLRSEQLSPVLERRKKVTFTVAIILIALLGVSLFFGVKKASLGQKKERYEKVYQEISSLVEEAEALVSLNPLSSRDQLLVASEKMAGLESLAIEKEKTTALKNRLEEVLRLVIKEKKVEPTVFFDLGLITAEAKGERFVLSQESLIVLDEAKNRLFNIDIEKKSGEVLAGGEKFEGTKFLTVYDGTVFTWSSQGIIRVSKGQENARTVVEKDTDWGEIGGLVSYAGNLYLLDKKKSKIWRYGAGEEGFSGKQNWFGEGINPDLSQSVSLTIDGSIWILLENGKILKFTRGAIDSFAVKNFEDGLSKPEVLWTDFETEKLYILEREKERVVVLGKNGEFTFQYRWEGLRETTDIAVSEKTGKLFILRGEKIYEVGLE